MLPRRASVVVVGGGPAGTMAAITAAEGGLQGCPGAVVVLEATGEPLHKVRISGGGRCNVTHGCWDPRALVGHYPRGGSALRGPFARFATGDAVAWFESHGLELVEEPDGRLFPRANRSGAVVDCLARAAAAAGVVVAATQPVAAVRALPTGGFRLLLRSGAELEADRLVLATGGHPTGYRLAASLGHSLVPPVPSLFTLALADSGLASLAGVSMEAVGLELLPPADPPAPGGAPAGLAGAAGAGAGAAVRAGTAARRATRARQRGPVLLTHWGLSGPATLRLTAFAARELKAWGYRAELLVDWSGGRSPADLQEGFSAARRDQARRQLGNWRPWPELSRRLWLHLLEAGEVDPRLRWADLGRRAEQALIASLRGSRYRVRGRGPFGEEFVTAGGIPLGEVNLATMESRLCPGLHLVGELLDVDGVTGGFNFQHCWTSGWLAGRALAERTPAAGLI